MSKWWIQLACGLGLFGLLVLVLWSWHLGGVGEPVGEVSVSEQVKLPNAAAAIDEVTEVERQEQRLKISQKQMKLKLGRLERQRREMALQSVELSSNGALADQLSSLQAKLAALPDGSAILDPGSGRGGSRTVTGRARMETREWQGVMENYARETGISRSEVEAILNAQ